MNLTPEEEGAGAPRTAEISRFCAAVRNQTPLACGPERAFHSARWTLAANQALRTNTPVKIA